MTTLLAAVTAAHPYLSGIGIWIVVSVIAAGIWAMCKERDDEDDVPAAPGLLSERRKVS
jgi:hypothetical protein